MSTLFAGHIVKSRPRLEVFGISAVELLLRPERFFRILLRFRAGSRPDLLIWIAGIAGAFDGGYSQSSIRAMTGRKALPWLESWYWAWPWVLVAGILSGALAWLVQGWWFRARLRLSGAPGDEVSPNAARLVWLHATLVWAVPALATGVLVTFLHSTPAAAFRAGTFGLTELGMAAWSIFVGYRGAVSCFPVKRTAALWWFLILPLAWYGTLLGTFLAYSATRGLP